MTGPIAVLRLPDDHTWLRVADTGWSDPLDPAWASPLGGRRNPPASFPVLYLNEDLTTARAQLHTLLRSWPANPEDLRGDAPYVLILVGLPRRQPVADALSDDGLSSLGLPTSYPFDAHGATVPHRICQRVATSVHDAGLRGVWCRSAATTDGTGRELAWFPSSSRSRARAVGRPLPFAQWWTAESVAG
ncbi:MAG TPA: RES domain-containing protein [Acidimicrobiales bacterium]